AGGMGPLNVWEFSEPVALSSLTLSCGTLPHPPARWQDEPFCFSPDSRSLAVEVGFPHQVVVFDRQTGSAVRSIEYRADDPLGTYALQFSPDGRILAALGVTGLLAWDVETGQTEIRRSAGLSDVLHLKMIGSAGFAKDGKILAGGSENSQPTVWDATTGAALWQGTAAAGVMAIVSPDGERVVSAPMAFWVDRFIGKQRTLPVVSLPEGRELFVLEAGVRGGMSA